ncbi:hypothetical protein TrRE_jg8819, partial [Triparma retinervis]
PTFEHSYFSVAISKIGLKDASTFGYIDPYIVVTVADARGCIIDQQQTPPARLISGSYIFFSDVVVNLSTPISQLEEGNCGIFFELMHYKSKKARTSCRCWGFMETDEIVNGGASLELYKKPADFMRRKKNIHLFSIKDLFLYVTGQAQSPGSSLSGAVTDDGTASVTSSRSNKSGFKEPSNFRLMDVIGAAAKKQNVSLFSVNRSRLESAGTMARNTHKKNYKYKVAEDGGGRGRSWSEKSSDQIAAQAGKSRAISAFNNNPNLGQASFANVNADAASMDGEDPNLMELQKQHLRGIFAAACTDHEGDGDMSLNSTNLREAVSMTGLYPGRALLGQFATGGKKGVDLSAFLAVILENLEYEKDMMDDLVTLFEMFDEDGTGTITAKSLRHLLMEVLTSDQTELSRAEFDEFLEYAGLEGGEIIDYRALANNFMLSKPELKMVVER